MNEQYVANFEKVATYLESDNLRVAFDIGRFDDREHNMGRNRQDCGSVGCVIGQSPFAGLEKIIGETWEDYSQRIFGLRPYSDEWRWCFGPSWAEVDNTPQGAAARMRYFVKHGLPDNWENQMYGCNAISY